MSSNPSNEAQPETNIFRFTVAGHYFLFVISCPVSYITILNILANDIKKPKDETLAELVKETLVNISKQIEKQTTEIKN